MVKLTKTVKPIKKDKPKKIVKTEKPKTKEIKKMKTKEPIVFKKYTEDTPIDYNKDVQSIHEVARVSYLDRISKNIEAEKKDHKLTKLCWLNEGSYFLPFGSDGRFRNCRVLNYSDCSVSVDGYKKDKLDAEGDKIKWTYFKETWSSQTDVFSVERQGTAEEDEALTTKSKVKKKQTVDINGLPSKKSGRGRPKKKK